MSRKGGGKIGGPMEWAKKNGQPATYDSATSVTDTQKKIYYLIENHYENLSPKERNFLNEIYNQEPLSRKQHIWVRSIYQRYIEKVNVEDQIKRLREKNKNLRRVIEEAAKDLPEFVPWMKRKYTELAAEEKAGWPSLKADPDMPDNTAALVQDGEVKGIVTGIKETRNGTR